MAKFPADAALATDWAEKLAGVAQPAGMLGARGPGGVRGPGPHVQPAARVPGQIGDRAVHSEPQAVADLAHSLLQGLRQGGMPTVGKHFPGHGDTGGDSHAGLPVMGHTHRRWWQLDAPPCQAAMILIGSCTKPQGNPVQYG